LEEGDSDEISDRDKSLVEVPAVDDEKTVVNNKSDPSVVKQSPSPTAVSDEGSSKNEAEEKETISKPLTPENEVVEPLKKESLDTVTPPAETIHQNGDIDLEDGELPADDGADSGAEDSESHDAPALETKTDKKMKYDRDTLMKIGKEVDSKKPPTDLIPDVLKDNNGANQMRHHVSC